MHPYYHALSSQREHGGAVEDYVPLHCWFDSSKTALAHFTHRCIYHHLQGIAEAVRIFGNTIRNADGVEVSVEQLSLQHIREDMSITPPAADWLKHLELPPTLQPPQYNPSAAQLAAASARNFDTTPDVTLPLHSWFLDTAGWFGDARHFAMRHHSFGIFAAEQTFGVALSANPRAIPTRIVAEWHVRTVLGRIPATADYLRRIKGQPWMAAAHNPRHRGLA